MSTLSVDTIQGQTTAANVKLPAGSIVQTVNAKTTTMVNVASTTHADTGLTATITPKYSTSKILVIISQSIGSDRDNNVASVGIIVKRDSTTIQTQSYVAYAEANNASAVKDIGPYSFTMLDSPSTTNATTYKTQGRINATSNNGTARFQWDQSESNITLLEISQ